MILFSRLLVGRFLLPAVSSLHSLTVCSHPMFTSYALMTSLPTPLGLSKLFHVLESQTRLNASVCAPKLWHLAKHGETAAVYINSVVEPLDAGFHSRVARAATSLFVSWVEHLNIFLFSAHHSIMSYFRCSVYWWKETVRFYFLKIVVKY